MPELIGKGERIELEEERKENDTTTESIDIDKILNKPRKQ